jgi:hypothetical protein
VNRWKVIFSLLLLAAWLPSALPCELKGALFPALNCCAAEQSQQGEKTDCSNCQICLAVAGGYAVSVVRITVPEIAPVVRIEAGPQDLIPDASLPTKSVVPPDLLPSWQFDLRAALPVRAPSFAS